MKKWLTNLFIALVAVFVTAALAGPIGPLPGVRLGGNETPAPMDWTTVSLPDEVQLKASGGLFPKVVNIWVVELNNSLYVFGARDSGWVNAVTSNPNVNLRINNQTFALQATPVENPGDEIYEQYVARYAADYPDIVEGMPQGEALAAAGSVFRLTANESHD